ncbi:MAG: DUF11 domain-containing protein, partial [Planctomycetes bacterium]|nr:DUF11 domain-containing protein [Planctomycetota bacterium]
GTTSGCTEDATGVPTCTLGTITAGNAKQYVITVTVDADTTGSVTNNITVTADNTINTGDDTASATTTINTQADLTLSKVDTPDPVTAGETLTYTIRVTNTGPSDAQNVVVTDSLPTGVTFGTTSGCTEDATGVPTCTLGTITAGNAKQYVITVTVDADTTGSVTNNITVTADNTINTGDDTASATTNINTKADLVISKSDDPDPVVAGETLTYTIRITNSGPSDALNVIVTDTLPAGVVFGSTNNCAEGLNGVP